MRTQPACASFRIWPGWAILRIVSRPSPAPLRIVTPLFRQCRDGGCDRHITSKDDLNRVLGGHGIGGRARPRPDCGIPVLGLPSVRRRSSEQILGDGGNIGNQGVFHIWLSAARALPPRLLAFMSLFVTNSSLLRHHAHRHAHTRTHTYSRAHSSSLYLSLSTSRVYEYDRVPLSVSYLTTLLAACTPYGAYISYETYTYVNALEHGSWSSSLSA